MPKSSILSGSEWVFRLSERKDIRFDENFIPVVCSALINLVRFKLSAP